MGSRAIGWLWLAVAASLLACGPREFGGGRTANDPPRESSDDFRSIGEGEDEEEGVIVSDDSDEAWDGVETDGGEDWYDEGEEGDEEGDEE